MALHQRESIRPQNRLPWRPFSSQPAYRKRSQTCYLIPSLGKLNGVAAGSTAYVQNATAQWKFQFLQDKVNFFNSVLRKGVVHINWGLLVEVLPPTRFFLPSPIIFLPTSHFPINLRHTRFCGSCQALLVFNVSPSVSIMTRSTNNKYAFTCSLC